MNYIEEVNSFYEWIRFKPIPAGAQALWHLLMNINNGCAVNIIGQLNLRSPMDLSHRYWTSPGRN